MSLQNLESRYETILQLDPSIEVKETDRKVWSGSEDIYGELLILLVLYDFSHNIAPLLWEKVFCFGKNRSNYH